MAKKIIKGTLTMLGNSKGHGDAPDWRVYSLIEIGEQTLRGVACHDFLDNYLRRALQHNGDVELELDPHNSRSRNLVNSLIGIGVGIALIPLAKSLENEFGPSFASTVVGGGFLLALLAIFFFFYVLFHNVTVFYTLNAVTIDGKRYTWRK